MGTGARMASIALPGENLINIDSKDVMKVLILDDEASFRNQASELFADWGCEVDSVATPEIAEKYLNENTYQMIVADVTIDNSPISGDEFVVQNAESLGGASVVIITGKGEYVLSNRRREELKAMGATILQKASAVRPLKEITVRKLEQQQALVRVHLKQSINNLIDGRAAEAIAAPGSYNDIIEGAKDLLIEWLKSRSEQNNREILFDGREYSISELVHEVEQGSEVGREHIRMLIDLFRYIINAKRG